MGRLAPFAVFKVHDAGRRSKAVGRFSPGEVSNASLAGSMTQLWTIRPEEEETREVTRNASVDDSIACLAARQHGVVTRSQLLAEGLTPRMVGSRVRSERLRPLHRGVYLLGSLRASLEPEHSREMAAVLACGPGAVLSHRSAAWIWELLPRPGGATPVEVTVPRRARPRRPGIRARRSDHLSADEATVLGLPVTTPGRTLRDLSTRISTRELSRAAARAERRGLIDADGLSKLVARHRGRPGAPLLRAALEVESGPAFTRSEAEERFLDLIGSGGLPAPEANVVVRGHEVDFLWHPAGIAVEVDGFGFHASRRSFENDRRRDAELAAVGVYVIRVTWRQIVDEPSATLVHVAQALARSTPRRAGKSPR